MIVNGYCKEVFNHLPAIGGARLLGVSLEGSVG